MVYRRFSLTLGFCLPLINDCIVRPVLWVPAAVDGGKGTRWGAGYFERKSACLVADEQKVRRTVCLPTVSRSSISSIMDKGSSSPRKPAAKRERADLAVRCVA